MLVTLDPGMVATVGNERIKLVLVDNGTDELSA